MANFNKFRTQFSTIYKQISRFPLGKYVTPTWKDFNQSLESVFLPVPKLNFLMNSLVMYSMVMTKGGAIMEKQIDFIKKVFGKKIAKIILMEDLVGSPMVTNKKYLSSHNRIHQAYHLARYESETGNKIKKNKVIVEWGAGYGNMVVVIKRLVAMPLTYVCIDTPLFISLQWLYLSSIFGIDKINVISSTDQKIIKNKINLIPVSLLEKIDLKCDLFITNWALSESSRISQNLVRDQKWFGAKHLLVGYQSNCQAFEQAEGVGKMVEVAGGKVEEIDLLPSNFYAFK